LTLPRYYNALILNSTRARVVLMLMDGDRPACLPARLALALKAPAVGVVNKIDLGDPKNLDRAEAALIGAGVEKIFRVSALTGAGLDELKRGLENF
ncbi:MAG: EutP/PduV family microcompartment system protein, partial [Candidatus Adiutrix sp.]|nr:EutP/PduV family microcompartment system protein [Candidatus Adiutrix sp.]